MAEVGVKTRSVALSTSESPLLLSSRPMRPLAVALLALALVGTAVAGGPRVVAIGEQRNGDDTTVHVGDTLVVTLAATAAGSWKLTAVNRVVLRLDSTGYVPAAHPPLAAGARGIAVLTFKVVARGRTTLKLTSGIGVAAKHYIVAIIALPRGAP
jgi:hypothetical protein